MLELRIVSANKVDHPRKKSKDLADAMCGAVYNSIAYSQRDRIKEIEVHTYSGKSVERDSRYEDAPADRVKSMFSGRYRMI
jgi:hypothetical protein